MFGGLRAHPSSASLGPAFRAASALGLALVCAVRASFAAAGKSSKSSRQEGVDLQWEEAGPGGEARGGSRC